ncbi:hypothetical protein Q8F55_006876 [Vanrija albida]|uniref:Yeast cell wall synthesis Kre9/Knh1-like N-terminal domain-containing protein n=1 Tax=Vanrija albida TaxID=181172 RepID=A0ABR3PYG0_9TREE
MYALAFALALARVASAAITLEAPGADTNVKPGDHITASWLTDDTGSWTAMDINFMSGSDDAPIQLTQLATGIDATDPNATTYQFTVPNVNPYSQIYFLQFTTGNGSDFVDSPRFTISSPDGTTTPPTGQATDGSGNTYNWGNGSLADSANSTSAPASTSSGAQSGVGANGVTLYTNNINTGTNLPEGQATGVAQATVGAHAPGAGSALLAPGATLPAFAAVVGVLAGAALLA